MNGTLSEWEFRLDSAAARHAWRRRKCNTMRKDSPNEPALAPPSGEDIARVRQRCLRLVRKRAAIAAGVAAVPLPGIDVLTDLTTFALLVEEINQAFGLTPRQVERLHPRLRVLVYEAAAGVGGMLVGKFVTRGLALRLFRREGAKVAAKTVAKLVPLAGQTVSAAISFALFRKLGNQHVEACVKVVREVEAAGR